MSEIKIVFSFTCLSSYSAEISKLVNAIKTEFAKIHGKPDRDPQNHIKHFYIDQLERSLISMLAEMTKLDDPVTIDTLGNLYVESKKVIELIRSAEDLAKAFK